jgi:hypothetical protein
LITRRTNKITTPRLAFRHMQNTVIGRSQSLTWRSYYIRLEQ